MTTQNDLKHAAKEKGYFLDIINHMKGKYTKKVEFNISNPLGETVYNKTFKWTQNAEYESEIFVTIPNLPANSFKSIDSGDDVDFLLSGFMNDEEPDAETVDGGSDLWDWFESEAAA